MTGTSTPRRLDPQASVKEDMHLLHGMMDDSYAQILNVVRSLQVSDERATKLMSDLQALKDQEVAAVKVLGQLNDQTGDACAELEAIQQAVDSSAAIGQENSRKQAEVLVDLCDTLRDIFSAQESLKTAVVGLTAQLHSQPCPWIKDGEEITAEARMRGVDELISMVPQIKVMLGDVLDQYGWEQQTLGGKEMPKQKWWGKRFMDQLKDATVTIFLSGCAGLLIGTVAPRILNYMLSSGAPTESEELKKLRSALETSEREAQIKTQALEAMMQADLDRSKKRRKSPATDE